MTDTNNTTPAAQSSDDIGTAAEALKLGRAEFEKAQAFYENVRQQATERLQSVRKTSIGDVIDGTLETVRRHPGAGLGVAAIVGYFLGRLFRR